MKFGLIGEKLNYSYSPQIHNEFYINNNIDATYDLIELNSNELESFIKDNNYDGFNVTIPYKKQIVKHLDNVDKVSSIVGVNTIIYKDKKTYGYNTDIIGFDLMMKYNNIDFDNKEVVILGSGSTSDMIKLFLEDKNTKKVMVASRNPSDNQISYDDINEGDILINATPIGMSIHKDKSPINESIIDNFDILIDLIYNPFHTKFLKEGILRNKVVINGLYMLVAQAIFSEGYFLSRDVTIEDVNRVYNKIKKDVSNIVIIGMPGSGKTTISKIISDKLGLQFIDIDQVIEERTGESITNIFKNGENYFRDIESSIIKKLSNEKNSVISAGGGVVLRNENMMNLMDNGIVFYIDRNVDDILNDINYSNRPVLKHTSLKSLYEKRKAMYEKYSLYHIKNTNINETIDKIIKVIGEI